MPKAEQIKAFLDIRGEEKASRSDIAALAREYGPTAVETLARVMQSTKTKPMVKVAAANALLDRGYGKATVHISAGDREDEELEGMALAILEKRGLAVGKVLDAEEPLQLPAHQNTEELLNAAKPRRKAKARKKKKRVAK